ncbi:MAG: LVIVD repeat-containing protein [Gemmatimonas sp.]
MTARNRPAARLGHLFRRLSPTLGTLAFAIAASGCGDGPSQPVDDNNPPSGDTTQVGAFTAVPFTLLGRGDVADRFTSELWVRGTTAYTSTWGSRGFLQGNAVKIWDVSGNAPTLVDSVIVSNAGTTGDIQVSDDGAVLAVAIEPRPNGGLAIYSLGNPRKPQLLVRYSSAKLEAGVHTAELARVGGTLYAFCAIDPGNLSPAQLVILSLANPASPVEVAALTIGNPLIHDVFVRDGYLFTAEWNDGMGIYDIGAEGGSVSNPRLISRTKTVGGQVHNVWWFQDPANGNKRYVFVGQEGPGSIGFSSVGDIHVVDISVRTSPREVAMFSLAGAGVHNFSMDEARGRLYAAYYNGGVRALGVRGDLSACATDEKTADGRCDLAKMGRVIAFANTGAAGLTYVWGVHAQSNALYASDMLSGLYKFALP